MAKLGKFEDVQRVPTVRQRLQALANVHSGKAVTEESL